MRILTFTPFRFLELPPMLTWTSSIFFAFDLTQLSEPTTARVRDKSSSFAADLPTPYVWCPVFFLLLRKEFLPDDFTPFSAIHVPVRLCRLMPPTRSLLRCAHLFSPSGSPSLLAPLLHEPADESSLGASFLCFSQMGKVSLSSCLLPSSPAPPFVPSRVGRTPKTPFSNSYFSHQKHPCAGRGVEPPSSAETAALVPPSVAGPY